MVLRALISEETNGMKNRVTVIAESFQKSVFYILLRGREKKGLKTINLPRVLSSLIKLSDRISRKQINMAPEAAG